MDFFIDIYSEIYSNGYQIIWLDLISIGSLLSGIFVIITRNPVVAVLYLITLFMQISGFLLLIGIGFIGLSYILVYLGAISILFLFTIMLINIRISDLQTDNGNGVILGFITAIAFYFPVFNIFISTKPKWKFLEYNFNTNNVTTSSSSWDGSLSQFSEISSLGNILYTSHMLLIILAGVILLLAMVGAITITVNYSNPSSAALGFARRKPGEHNIA